MIQGSIVAKHALSAFVLSCLSAVTMAEPFPGARETDIEVGSGVQIHTVDGGAPDAKVSILFVPGWSMSSDVWRDQMAAFAPSSHVVAIDPRSQGRSTITTQSNTPEQRAQDLRRVIQALKLNHLVLVGWSQGVQDVAAYADAFQGEAICGYVLVDAAVGAGAGAAISHPRDLQEQLERLAFYEQHPRAYLQGMMQAIIQSPAGRKRIDELVDIGLHTPPDLGISMLMMDFIAVDRRTTLAKFNRPTLIIAAAQSDELEQQRRMSTLIKGAEFKTVDNAGHAVFLDQPARFHDLLADFVKRCS